MDKISYAIPVSENFDGLDIAIDDIVACYEIYCGKVMFAKITDGYYVIDIGYKEACDRFVTEIKQKYHFITPILIRKRSRGYYVCIRVNSKDKTQHEKFEGIVEIPIFDLNPYLIFDYTEKQNALQNQLEMYEDYILYKKRK